MLAGRESIPLAEKGGAQMDGEIYEDKTRELRAREFGSLEEEEFG